jgi:hypothetical protein
LFGGRRKLADAAASERMAIGRNEGQDLEAERAGFRWFDDSRANVEHGICHSAAAECECHSDAGRHV